MKYRYLLPACLIQHITMHGWSQAVTLHEQPHWQSQHKTLPARPALPCLPACQPDIFTALPARHIYCFAYLPLDTFTALPTCWTYLLPACLTQHITMHHQSQAVTLHKQSYRQSQHKMLAARPALPYITALPTCWTYLLPACLTQHVTMHGWLQAVTSHKQSQHKMLAARPALPCLSTCLPDIFTALPAFLQQSHWPSQPKTSTGHNHPTPNTYLIILIYIIFFTI